MTLRSEIRELLAAHTKGMLMDDMFAACASVEDEKKFRANLSVLKAEGMIKVVSTTDEDKPRAVYGLGDWPEKEPSPARAKKSNGRDKHEKKTRAAPDVTIINNVAAATAARNDAEAAQFAINENGELGIEKAGSRIHLDGSEFARLRAFVDRTEEAWKPKGAESK